MREVDAEGEVCWSRQWRIWEYTEKVAKSNEKVDMKRDN